MKINNIGSEGEGSGAVLQRPLVVNPNEKQGGTALFGFTNIFTRSIPVCQTSFYDLGFDPDFSIDGNFFYQQQYSFNIRLLIKKIIRAVMRYIPFFKEPERKAFQELVAIERNWQKAAQANGMLYAADKYDQNKAFWQIKAPFICELHEHLFLKKLAEIGVPSSAKNAYARELLLPLHKFNRPQSPSIQSKEHVFQGAENGDVARLSLWGFVLLDNHTKGKESYIEHRDFLHAIDGAGLQLKHAMRDLRMAIREEDYSAFDEKLRIFNNSWGQYVESHSLLQELFSVYSQKGFFDDAYQRLEDVYKKMQDPNAYENQDLYCEINEDFTDVSAKNLQGSKQLYDTLLSKFPNSPSVEEHSQRKED